MKKAVLLVSLFILVYFLFKGEGSGPNVSQNGIATNQFVSELFSKYDVNQNNQLEVTDETFLRVKIKGVTKVESRGLLFNDADEMGNADGLVSISELYQFLNQFDTDGDGEITTYKNIFASLFKGGSEWSKFNQDYAEKIQYK